MSNHYTDCVLQFHQKHNIPVPAPGDNIPADRIELRKRLICEEVAELVDAWLTDKLDVKMWLKEAADVLYVIEGAKIEFGSISLFGEFGSDKKKMSDIFGRMLFEARKIEKETIFYKINISITEITCELETLLHRTELMPYFKQVFDAVHASNMSKGTNGKPVYDAGGKLLKGEDYKPADLSFLDNVTL